MLGIEELADLEEKIRSELDLKLESILSTLNRKEQLEDFLSFVGLESLLKKESGYQVYKTGKVLVIGESDVKESDLLGVVKSLGLKKDRFEFHLSYEDAKVYDFNRLQWNPSWALVIAGAMPHSGKSKGDYSSVLTRIETEEGYPPVVRFEKLKVSKSEFKTILSNQINSGVLK